MDTRLRKQPTQSRSRATVDAFLEAADRVLTREGYEAASTNRLARVAGFSVGSLYQYFDDKQAVVGTLIDRALQGEARELARLLEKSHERDPGALIQLATDHLLSHRMTHAHLHRTLAEHGVELGGISGLRYAARVQDQLLGDTLQRIALPHLLRAGGGNVESRLCVLVRTAHAVTHQFAVEQPAHVGRELLVQVIRSVLGGYVTKPTAPRAAAAELAERWRSDAGADAWSGARRARRLQEVRSLLLQAGIGRPDRLEPAVFLGAAVYELIHEWEHRSAERSDVEAVTAECARLLESLLHESTGTATDPANGGAGASS